MTGTTKNGSIQSFSRNPSFSTLNTPSNPILQTARNRVQQFVIHLVPETATVRSCVVWLISIARSTDFKPVQLDSAVTREAQYWSDQLNLQHACWFLYHDYNYHARHAGPIPGSSIPRKRSV